MTAVSLQLHTPPDFTDANRPCRLWHISQQVLQDALRPTLPGYSLALQFLPAFLTEFHVISQSETSCRFSSFPKWRCPCRMKTNLPSLKYCTAPSAWTWDSSVEDYRGRNTAHESHISVACETGNGRTGKLVYKLSAEICGMRYAYTHVKWPD